MLNGVEAAQVLCERLLSLSTSLSYLFLLKLRRETLDRADVGGALLELCDDLRVDPHRLSAQFYAEVERIMALPSTTAFAMLHPLFSIKKHKDPCIQEYYRLIGNARRTSCVRSRFNLLGALMPFSFQIMGSVYSLKQEKAVMIACFFMYATPEEGMRRIVQLFKDNYRFDTPWCETNYYQQIIEQRFGGRESQHGAMDNRLSYLIVDWEVLQSKMGDRLAHDEVQARMREAPLWFYRQILEAKFVDPTTTVRILLKNKSRCVKDKDGNSDYKHSAHLIFNLMGLTTELAHLCAVLARPFEPRLALCKESFDALKDAELQLPWFAVDWKALGGNTGFSCPLSKKKVDEPLPVLERYYVFRNGERLPDVLPAESAPTDEEGYYRYIAASLCTVPRIDTAPFAVHLMASLQSVPIKAHFKRKVDQDRTDAKRHQATSGGSRSTSSSVVDALPGWIGSTLVRGCSVSTKWSECYFMNLQGVLDNELEGWVHMHVKGGVYCPVSLCQATPRKVMHDSNAVILAYNPSDPEFVYCRCTHCTRHPNPHKQVTMIRRAWVQYSKENYEFLMGVAK